jgi:hypothetical protein
VPNAYNSRPQYEGVVLKLLGPAVVIDLSGIFELPNGRKNQEVDMIQ